jgi:hypothetical protein
MRDIKKVVFVWTGDLDFVEDYSSDVTPYQIWVDLELAQNEEIADFLQEYQEEFEALRKGEIDYIVIEYDM